MSKMPQDVIELFDDPQTLKMVGTVDKQKNPGLINIGTLGVLDAETLVFADVSLGRTKQSLESTKRVTVGVYKPPMSAYQAKGVFMGWQTSGPAYDKHMPRVKEMLTAAGISDSPKAIGIVRVDEVYATGPLSGGMKVA